MNSSCRSIFFMLSLCEMYTIRRACTLPCRLFRPPDVEANANTCRTRREAQRAAVQLLSPLSQQFQSTEVHIIFEEGVQLTWEGNSNEEATPEPALHQPEEGTQPEGNIGGVGRRRGLAQGLSSSPESGGPRNAGPTGTETAGQREGLSLTRFLSNVVVACGQVTVPLVACESALICGVRCVADNTFPLKAWSILRLPLP